MSPDVNLRSAKQIFDRAVELPAEERLRLLESACGSDPELRRQVERMIEEFDKLTGTAAEQSEIKCSEVAADAVPEFKGSERFAVQRKLGSGAFGTVYQVWDRDQQVTLAAKVLHSRKPDILFRFKREFRRLIDIRHPNLVRLYELFSADEQWFFTMELVDGNNFLESVRASGICDFDRLRSTLAQLVDGVQALHRAKLVHRDLKPANALVTTSGRVVILDFGLVREFHAEMVEQSQTLIAGTPAYMAPEQVLEGFVNEASDWYSIGVMLFQALTGKLPNPESIVERALQTSGVLAPEPHSIDPTIPEDLNELCRLLLQTAPKDRPDPSVMLRLIGAPSATPLVHAADARNDTDQFVGRSEQLKQLESAFSETQEGHFNVVLLHGRSGIGKTALVQNSSHVWLSVFPDSLY
jgi:serine/threonine protein kinase